MPESNDARHRIGGHVLPSVEDALDDFDRARRVTRR